MAAPNHIVKRNREEETQASVFETRQKMVAAANMRKEGHGYPHIATTIGCSRSYAEKLVRKALREIIEESFQELVKIETARLDAIFLPAFLAATQTDKDGNPIFNKEATDTAIKIMERRARFLGLDKPVKAEISGDFNIGSSVQVYIPHNGRDLPSGLTIENGEIVSPVLNVINDDLEFDDGDDDDLSELLYDNSPVERM
jgi:hypothetical protein